MIFDDDEAGPGWLRTVVPIDPLLNAPLELYGSRAKRKTQIDPGSTVVI